MAACAFTADGRVCILVQVRPRGTGVALWLFGFSGFSQIKSCFVDGGMVPAAYRTTVGPGLAEAQGRIHLGEAGKAREPEIPLNHPIAVLDLSRKYRPTGEGMAEGGM